MFRDVGISFLGLPLSPLHWPHCKVRISVERQSGCLAMTQDTGPGKVCEEKELTTEGCGIASGKYICRKMITRACKKDRVGAALGTWVAGAGDQSFQGEPTLRILEPGVSDTESHIPG